MARALRLGLIALTALASAACGPSMGTTDDGGTSGGDGATAHDGAAGDSGPRECNTPCACAERGTPDFSREGTGQASASSSDMQRTALARANHWRTAAGVAPLNAQAQIEQAATAHAHYLATTDQRTCWANPHVEVSGCMGFTGAQMSNRMQMAGYQLQRASEVINWESTVEGAIDGWIWTVYHRQPFMDYRYTETGFGREVGPFSGRMANHTVMDFGTPRGAMGTAPMQPAVFPLPGQTGVPPAFRGDLEGPTPTTPMSTGRWPSGTVVSVHFPSAMWTITAHRIFQSDPATGACTELPHTYLSKDNDPNLNRGAPANDVFLYGDAPLARATEYVVQFEGTFNSAPYARTWAFTTQ